MAVDAGALRVQAEPTRRTKPSHQSRFKLTERLTASSGIGKESLGGNRPNGH